MFEFDLDPRDAFDQLFVIGLASILDAVTGSASRFEWGSGNEALIDSPGARTLEEASSLVRAHADHQANSRWLGSSFQLSIGERSPLSPRVGKLATRAAFVELEEARRTLIDSVPPDEDLTRRFMGALGRPSDWALSRTGDIYPDAGASAWEMKTRNRGEEFIRNRLLLLARAVSQRTDAQVLDGLAGSTNVDEVGKNALTSRTPTGLRDPGSTDKSRAWCALWGLSALPVRPVVGRPGESSSVTTGALRNRGAVWFYLPEVRNPTTVAGFRSVAQSKHLADQAGVAVRIPGVTASSKSVRWLNQHHIDRFFTFRRHRSDNPNAPELWAEPGVLNDLSRSPVLTRQPPARRGRRESYVF